MYMLKDKLTEKLTEKLSHLFADSNINSPSSPSSPYSPHSPRPLDPSQAKLSSRGGRSMNSFFTHANSENFDGSRSNQHHDVKSIQSPPTGGSDEICRCQYEPLDSFIDCSPVCNRKKRLTTHEENKKHSPGTKDKDTLNNHEDHEDHEDSNSGRSTCDSDVFEQASEPQSSEKSVPDFTADSAFISPDLYGFLESSLPNIVRGCQWVLLYSTLKHGISLSTLIRKSTDLPGPCLLIVGDMQGAVFGGLLECPFKPTAKRKYQGTNETFVFTTMYGAPKLFRPTGVNRYFYLCLNDLLALGGGGNFALSLDGDLLNGTSGHCDTFENLCLSHTPEFEVKNVELWGFRHSSQYLTGQEV